MTADELAAAGRALYGERWQTPLALDLNVAERSLRRWLNRESSVPKGVELEVRERLIKRFRQIGNLIGYLLNKADRSVLHYPTNALFRYEQDGELALAHSGVTDQFGILGVTEGAREVVRKEIEREKVLAEGFVRASAWWLTHSSYRPVRAPRHAERLYMSHHGWAVDFGANSFLVGKAIERCQSILDQCEEEAAAGHVVSRVDIEAKLKKAISGAVANSNGEEYQGYYPIKGDLLVFGAQGIGVDDGASYMINEANLRWDGEALAVPEPPAAADRSKIEDLPFNPTLLKIVDELELSMRTAYGLKNQEIVYLGDLVQKSEADMLRLPNFGRKSLNEIKEVLAQLGLQLGVDVPSWPPLNIEELAQAYGTQLDE
ncbi:hypothetical protein ACVILH_004285 [Bradyrhizobium sp. USDA 4353]